MAGLTATELILIRHAPARSGGRLCGRTDVAADVTDPARLTAVRLAAGQPGRLFTSPARRCIQTANALWPGWQGESHDALWEQDFGAWEGMPHAALPDLGPLSGPDLASHRPPGGESFADLCARTTPLLAAIAEAGDATIVAHAGTVRAALCLVVGEPGAALSFDVQPLSVTRIVRLGASGWAVRATNWTPA